MITYISKSYLSFLINLFSTYPQDFVITCFCKDKELKEKVENTFLLALENLQELKVQKKKDCTLLYHNKTRLYIKVAEPTNVGRWSRSNITLIDSRFPYQYITELFLPITNLRPCGYAHVFDEETFNLKKEDNLNVDFLSEL